MSRKWFLILLACLGLGLIAVIFLPLVPNIEDPKVQETWAQINVVGILAVLALLLVLLLIRRRR